MSTQIDTEDDAILQSIVMEWSNGGEVGTGLFLVTKDEEVMLSPDELREALGACAVWASPDDVGRVGHARPAAIEIVDSLSYGVECPTEYDRAEERIAAAAHAHSHKMMAALVSGIKKVSPELHSKMTVGLTAAVRCGMCVAEQLTIDEEAELQAMVRHLRAAEVS